MSKAHVLMLAAMDCMLVATFGLIILEADQHNSIESRLDRAGCVAPDWKVSVTDEFPYPNEARVALAKCSARAVKAARGRDKVY